MAQNPQAAEKVKHALSEAQKRVVLVQQALVEANPLASQIPMYEKLGKMVADLRGMMVELAKLPL